MKVVFVLSATLALALGALAAPKVERGAPLPRKAALGVQLGPVAAGEPAGVKILQVSPGLTAEALGVKNGDILLAIDGTAVKSIPELSPLTRGLYGGKKVTLTVQRGTEKLELKGDLKERPRQNDSEVEVVYDQFVSEGKRIRWIGTYPKGKGKGPFPTIFLIGGIGAYSVDANFATFPYGNIMKALSDQGYATVRIDKPGQGDSEGPAYADLLFDTELNAYINGIRLAKTTEWINKDKIAIFGHSMGGAFGPLVAAEEPVAALAVGATAAKTWFEYMIENNRRQALLGGASPAQVDESVRQQIPLWHYIFNKQMSPQEIIAKEPELGELLKAISPDLKTFSGAGIVFFQGLSKKNLMEAWSKVTAPALLYYGENDFVSGRDDHEFVVASLNKVRPGQATFKLLANSDHGFFKTESPLDSMQKWGRPGNTHNPNIEESLIEWFGKVLK